MLARNVVPVRDRKSVTFTIVLKPRDIKQERTKVVQKSKVDKFERLYFKFESLSDDIESELCIKFKVKFPVEDAERKQKESDSKMLSSF